MRMLPIAVLLISVALPNADAFGQTMSARRMAMGSASLGGDAANVAYRAVPKVKGRSAGFTLPIGLVKVLSDPPSFDPGDPNFNVFKIANLIQNPPWNLQLGTAEAPSSDVVVNLGRDHLAVDLGDIRSYLPGKVARISALQTLPAPAIGFGPWFAGLSVITQYDNDLQLNQPLRQALEGAEPFLPLTEYAVIDSGLGQAIAAIQTGAAIPLMLNGTDPRERGGMGLYGGARISLLRGIEYADMRNVVSFATSDTLFGSTPVVVDYAGDFRNAGPAGGGWGQAFDLGAVIVAGKVEFGFGVNHIGARVNWHGREQQTVRDSVTGDYKAVVVNDDLSFSTALPVVLTANIIRPIAGVLVAADVTHASGVTEGHLGLERWFGPLALRAGGRIDEAKALQSSAGVGTRFGPVGVDVAVASHGQSFGSAKRSLELAAGLSFYH